MSRRGARRVHEQTSIEDLLGEELAPGRAAGAAAKPDFDALMHRLDPMLARDFQQIRDQVLPDTPNSLGS